jgi:hypothetical protein
MFRLEHHLYLLSLPQVRSCRSTADHSKPGTIFRLLPLSRTRSRCFANSLRSYNGSEFPPFQSHRTKPALAVHTSDRSGDLRGRHAQTPAQIPPAGWRDVALRVFHGISENRVATISGGVTGQCREELTQLNELRSISGCLVLMQRKPIVSA